MVLGLLACGCASRAGRGVNVKPYFGPTESMAEVAATVNTNNRLLPTLWARHDFEATIIDDKGKSRFVNGDGAMLYRRPGELLLRGNKDVVGRIFEIGSTDERYWLTLNTPEESTQWWGLYRNLGKPCSEPIPIRPDMVLEVLGISAIDTDFNRLPAPVMRFNNDARAYMFVWHDQRPDRWWAVKEIWYDLTSKRPTKVLLFDPNGRIVLRANLTGHRPVAVADLPQSQWPVVATDFRLFFPDTQSRMWIRLRDVVLSNKGIPREGSIRFPAEVGVSRVIQLDKDCEQ